MRQSRQRPQQSCLPRSVVAQDGVKPSGIKFGGNAAQGGETPELLDDVINRDDGRRGGLSHSSIANLCILRGICKVADAGRRMIREKCLLRCLESFAPLLAVTVQR